MDFCNVCSLLLLFLSEVCLCLTITSSDNISKLFDLDIHLVDIFVVFRNTRVSF